MEGGGVGNDVSCIVLKAAWDDADTPKHKDCENNIRRESN